LLIAGNGCPQGSDELSSPAGASSLASRLTIWLALTIRYERVPASLATPATK